MENEQEIGKTMVDYFKTMFTLSNPTSFDSILDDIDTKVTTAMNAKLTKCFTVEKVEQALKQMKLITALGPDRMPPIFYKAYWSTVGPDVIDATLSVLNSGTMPPLLNHTFISLIPKIKSPKRAKDFHPISLCNVMYKLISKSIAKILKLISESQSAFMSNRLITNNILVAFETLHHLKNRRQGKTGFMALKLDMSKAYDRVEWVFLEKIMKKLGFDDKRIALISTCIRLVSFSVMVNGEPCGLFHPNRGLHQEDPLSPYLFLLCAKGLHSLIKQAKNNGTIRGVSLCKNGPRVSHLFFADDNLLFCRANNHDCGAILEVLDKYEQASGQQINRDKTQICFSTNMERSIQESIKALLRVAAITQYEKYLGLSSFVGRAKKQSFSYIRVRI